MDGRLEGLVAVVTGAGDGIGAGVARRYAAEGARVVVAEINPESGQAVADDIGGTYMQVDVTDRHQIEDMVATTTARFGRVDVLVNNAWGASTVGHVENKSDEAMHSGFTTGFYGPFWAMRAAFPHMKAQQWGRIVNMCSLSGVNAHVGTLEYNAAKEALRTLTRTAAREWAPTGVVVNAICPGAKSAAYRRVMSEHPELAEKSDRENPMGRIGDPERDIAPVAVFLASEDCRYLTGNTLFADGGAHINGVSWAPNLEDSA